jgi:hypothetical protein
VAALWGPFGDRTQTLYPNQLSAGARQQINPRQARQIAPGFFVVVLE